MERIGVFSGGGAYGAEKVGVLNALTPKYDRTYGCSTGALIAPLAALGEYELLKEVYLSVNNDNIFNVDPFRKNGKLKRWSAIFRLLSGKKSLGESENLLELIRKSYTPVMHTAIKDRCTVVRYNLAQQKIDYVNSGDVNWFEFTKAMWHSANAPIIMSFSDGMIDGGIVEVTPMEKAVRECSEGGIVDVYLCRKKYWADQPTGIGTFKGFLLALYSAMRKSIEHGDIHQSNEIAKSKNIRVKIDYLHPTVSGDSLFFDKKLMTEWYNIGFNKVARLPIEN